jgi:hypothetical protein
MSTVGTHASINFLFESTPLADNGYAYVDVLADSALVPGKIVTQNAGSSDPEWYYQVGGGGLNGAFASKLEGVLGTVNARLQSAYAARFGAHRFANDPTLPLERRPLTSFLVELDPQPPVGRNVAGMMYSVGPRVGDQGLTGDLLLAYTQVYVDAMAAIASSPTKIDGFRITLISSGIYLDAATVEPFSLAAAGAIINAVRIGVKKSNGRLTGLSILINTSDKHPEVITGFTRAATAAGAKVTGHGFTVAVP